jgi:hypothetical protein
LPVIDAYCPNCGRRVYVGEEDERVCPVCTGPLDITQLGESRAERIGRNEGMVREVNERIESAAQADGESSEELEEFVCECGSPDCTERISLKIAEYERVTAHPKRYVIALNHELPEVEVVVEKLPRYWVVEKNGEAAEAANDNGP